MPKKIMVNCPACGGSVRLADESKLGHKIRCPECEVPFVAALDDDDEPADNFDDAAADEGDIDDEPQPVLKRKSSGAGAAPVKKAATPKTGNEGLIVIGAAGGTLLVFGLIAGALYSAGFFDDGPRPVRPAANLAAVGGTEDGAPAPVISPVAGSAPAIQPTRVRSQEDGDDPPAVAAAPTVSIAAAGPGSPAGHGAPGASAASPVPGQPMAVANTADSAANGKSRPAQPITPAGSDEADSESSAATTSAADDDSEMAATDASESETEAADVKPSSSSSGSAKKPRSDVPRRQITGPEIRWNPTDAQMVAFVNVGGIMDSSVLKQLLEKLKIDPGKIQALNLEADGYRMMDNLLSVTLAIQDLGSFAPAVPLPGEMPATPTLKDGWVITQILNEAPNDKQRALILRMDDNGQPKLPEAAVQSTKFNGQDVWLVTHEQGQVVATTFPEPHIIVSGTQSTIEAVLKRGPASAKDLKRFARVDWSRELVLAFNRGDKGISAKELLPMVPEGLLAPLSNVIKDQLRTVDVGFGISRRAELRLGLHFSTQDAVKAAKDFFSGLLIGFRNQYRQKYRGDLPVYARKLLDPLINDVKTELVDQSLLITAAIPEELNDALTNLPKEILGASAAEAFGLALQHRGTKALGGDTFRFDDSDIGDDDAMVSEGSGFGVGGDDSEEDLREPTLPEDASGTAPLLSGHVPEGCELLVRTYRLAEAPVSGESPERLTIVLRGPLEPSGRLQIGKVSIRKLTLRGVDTNLPTKNVKLAGVGSRPNPPFLPIEELPLGIDEEELGIVDIPLPAETKSGSVIAVIDGSVTLRSGTVAGQFELDSVDALKGERPLDVPEAAGAGVKIKPAKSKLGRFSVSPEVLQLTAKRPFDFGRVRLLDGKGQRVEGLVIQRPQDTPQAWIELAVPAGLEAKTRLEGEVLDSVEDVTMNFRFTDVPIGTAAQATR